MRPYLRVVGMVGLAAGLSLADPPVIEVPASAEVCGRCHRAIHEAWKRSAHARAMENRRFQDAAEAAEAEQGAEARRLCLSCHSPVGLRIGDLALQRKVSWEGVTCDYCHSLREVSLTDANPRARIEFSLVKTGPGKAAAPGVHGAAFSPVHTSALACAPCHEYKNAAGFSVLTTYSEWKNSRAAREGKACQACHMYLVAGKVVEPRIQRTGGVQVNLHEMPGSHSLEQLNRTIAVNVRHGREGAQLKVSVDVVNRTAGHYVPTGSPLRRLVLEVTADSHDGQHFRGERVYWRRVADAQGTPLEHEHRLFPGAVKLLSDTRLAPDEKRTEEFSFPIPPGILTDLKVKMWYYYSPAAGAQSPNRVTFMSLGRLVR